MTTVTITTTMDFEAAHYIPTLPPEHKCHRLHGHNYKITVNVESEVVPGTGFEFDFDVVDAAVDSLVISALDHRLLNDIDGLDVPTAENIAIWALRRLMLTAIPVSSVTIWETPRYSATVQRAALC